MADIIQFKKPKKPASLSNHMYTLHMFQTENVEYEVEMDVNDEFDDTEIFDGIMAAGFRFGIDHNIVPEEDDDGE